MRHKSKSLIYPCGLPHLKQRLTLRVENFGFFCDFAICDFFAILKIKAPNALQYTNKVSQIVKKNTDKK